MGESDVKRFIKGINDLSTLPAIFGKIISITGDEESSPEELYKIVTLDQALAGRVLRVANSAFFGHSGQITDTQQAIMFLGYERIKSIALGMTMMDIFPSRNTFHVENLWTHGYEVAFLSSALSECIPMSEPGECFLSGLLHDIGRIIFYSMDHHKFSKVELGDDMLEQEKGIFGCTHAEAGAWFIEQMGLPNELALTTVLHHNPSAAQDRREFVSITALAEALSRRFSPRIEDDGIWTTEHDAILLEFSLTPEDLNAVGERLAGARSEIEGFFSIT